MYNKQKGTRIIKYGHYKAIIWTKNNVLCINNCYKTNNLIYLYRFYSEVVFMKTLLPLFRAFRVFRKFRVVFID